jgi:hypothetical protein
VDDSIASLEQRDILYWAEYYDRDPILPGRDPKQNGGDCYESSDLASQDI